MDDEEQMLSLHNRYLKTLKEHLNSYTKDDFDYNEISIQMDDSDYEEIKKELLEEKFNLYNACKAWEEKIIPGIRLIKEYIDSYELSCMSTQEIYERYCKNNKSYENLMHYVQTHSKTHQDITQIDSMYYSLISEVEYVLLFAEKQKLNFEKKYVQLQLLFDKM